MLTPKTIRPAVTTTATKNNILVGENLEASEAQDKFNESMSRLAYPSRTVKGKRSRRSRFFFDMSGDNLEERKKAVQPKSLDHVDAEVVARLGKYKEESTPLLKANMEHIREFFLTEIAPWTLSAAGGTLQASDVIRRMVESEVDPGMGQRFEQMVNRAAVLKMAKFVAETFGLPESDIPHLLGIPPKPDQNLGLERAMQDLASTLEKMNGNQKKLEDQIRRSARKESSRAVPRSN